MFKQDRVVLLSDCCFETDAVCGNVMFSIEIMSTVKAIKTHLKRPYDKKNLTLVIIMTPYRRGGKHIVFGAPVGVSVGVGVTLSCLHDISGTGGWILTNFAWMQHWDMMKSWLCFGDLDLIFKVTARLKLPILSQKVILCTISRELVVRFKPDL